MVDAVLLEIEDVLFDTRAARRSALSKALREHGFATDAPAELVDGFSPRDAAASALRAAALPLNEIELDLVRATAERIFASDVSSGGITLVPGALDFVRESVAQARVAVVTRARRGEAETLLALAAIDDLVSIVVTLDDVADGKPAPESYRRAIARFSRQRGVDERSIFAVEGTLAGIRGAHASALRCVAVGPLPAHIALEADAYAESLQGHSARTLELLARPGRERVQ